MALQGQGHVETHFGELDHVPVCARCQGGALPVAGTGDRQGWDRTEGVKAQDTPSGAKGTVPSWHTGRAAGGQIPPGGQNPTTEAAERP